MQLFLFTLIIVGICLALLSIRLFFGKGFVKTHVDQNKAMRQRGIHCVQAQDAQMRHTPATKVKERTNHTNE